MSPKAHPRVTEAWLTQHELELQATSPGSTLIYLLVDEAGAQLIEVGIVPEYVKRQARGALDWCQTDERGTVKAHKRMA